MIEIILGLALLIFIITIFIVSAFFYTYISKRNKEIELEIAKANKEAEQMKLESANKDNETMKIQLEYQQELKRQGLTDERVPMGSAIYETMKEIKGEE